VITTDVRGHVDHLNPIAESLLGCSTNEVLGLPLSDVFRIIEETDRDTEIKPIDIVTREMHPVKLAGDTILIRRDGHELAIDVSAAAIRDRATSMIGAVLVLKDVTRERQRTAQLSQQARQDPLTGLVNRREFEQRLARALEGVAGGERRHALLYIDLDRFKTVNDTSGHAAGDALLKEISGVLQRKLRDRDTLARLGGDEFAVLLENCTLDDAVRIADALCFAAADFKFAWQGRVFRIGVCIGLVAMTGQHLTVAEVLGAADSACYHAKRSGRNRVHILGADDGTELRLG
jgi:diguanylate cyclase (GGDEF)-like protein/PAS domain S-box-containing protein